jgi:hypothetical protein
LKQQSRHAALSEPLIRNPLPIRRQWR